jgi:hypothetical protein
LKARRISNPIAAPKGGFLIRVTTLWLGVIGMNVMEITTSMEISRFEAFYSATWLIAVPILHMTAGDVPTSFHLIQIHIPGKQLSSADSGKVRQNPQPPRNRKDLK